MDQSLRKTIIRRDRFVCRACGRRARVQVHYLLARGQGGSDAPANLVTLCGRCHMLVSPIPVVQLTAYFGITEAELLVRKARVEVAIHTWILSGQPAAVPSPAVAHPSVPTAAKPRQAKRRPVTGRQAKPSRPVEPRTPAPERWWKHLRPRAGRVWQPAEDAALLADFDAGLPLEAIAARCGRGTFSVEVRLYKLGRLAAATGDQVIS